METILLYKPTMHRVGRLVLVLILVVSGGGAALGEQASASPAKSSPASTPIPLAKVPSKTQSALASLQEIEATVSSDQSNADGIARALSGVTNETDARIAEDMRLLTTSPSLDVLFPLKLAWQIFGIRLSELDRELTQHATSLEEQVGRLDKLNQTWQATLQSAKQPETPPPLLQGVHNVVDSVERVRQATESSQAQIWDLQSRISEQEARVRTTLSSIEQGENRALKNLFVRDSPPIWNLKTSLGTEWAKHSGKSFSLQLKASAAFATRLPFTFLIHALLMVLLAAALHWLRGRIRTLAEEKPDLQRALPILDLPVSTAFALSMLLIPSIYKQAPPLIYGIMALVTLVPTVLILRRLLERNSYPILNGLVLIFLFGLLRVLAAPLPLLARLMFLGQVLGAILLVVWVLRSWHLPAESLETQGRVWRIIRLIAKIGLVLLPAAFLANIFGYVSLGNFLGIIFLRSVYIGAVLYTGIRIIEGLVTIALQVQPLSSLRVISLHRAMLQRRTCRVLEFLAFLVWLNLVLKFRPLPVAGWHSPSRRRRVSLAMSDSLVAASRVQRNRGSSRALDAMNGFYHTEQSVFRGFSAITGRFRVEF